MPNEQFRIDYVLLLVSALAPRVLGLDNWGGRRDIVRTGRRPLANLYRGATDVLRCAPMPLGVSDGSARAET